MIQTTDEMITRARAMAEDFAKLKTSQFLRAFLSDTLIASELKRLEESKIPDDRYLDLLVNEYQIPFGQALSLAYACGVMDQAQGVPSNLYRKGQEAAPRSESPVELVKPGDV